MKIFTCYKQKIHISTALILFFASMGCTVKYTYLKPNYNKVERQSLKRIALVIEPYKALPENINNLLFTIEKEYLSIKTNYIIKNQIIVLENQNAQNVCRSKFKLNGYLITRLEELKIRKNNVDIALRLILYDCSHNKIWESYGKNSYRSNDSSLRATIDSLTNRTGENVRLFVAPIYRLTNLLLKSLPQPNLTDEEEIEKIESM